MGVAVKTGYKPVISRRIEQLDTPFGVDAALEAVSGPVKELNSKDSLSDPDIGMILELDDTGNVARSLRSDSALLSNLEQTCEKLRADGEHIIPPESVQEYYDHECIDASLIGFDVSSVKLPDFGNEQQRTPIRLKQWEDRRRTFCEEDRTKYSATYEIASCAVNRDSVESINDPSEVRGYKMAITSSDMSQRFEILVAPADRLEVLGTGNGSLHDMAVEYAAQGHSPSDVKKLILRLCKDRQIETAELHNRF